MALQIICIFCVILSTVFSDEKLQPEIVNLGNNIMQQLESPTRENADLLKKSLFNYLEMLQEINDLIWSKDGEVVSIGMATFDDLEEAGGPPHIVHNLNYKMLVDKCNWSEGVIKQIKSVVNDTRDLWESVKERANRLRIGTWGVDSKVEEETPSPNGDEDSDGELH